MRDGGLASRWRGDGGAWGRRVGGRQSATAGSVHGHVQSQAARRWAGWPGVGDPIWSHSLSCADGRPGSHRAGVGRRASPIRDTSLAVSVRRARGIPSTTIGPGAATGPCPWGAPGGAGWPGAAVASKTGGPLARAIAPLGRLLPVSPAVCGAVWGPGPLPCAASSGMTKGPMLAVGGLGMWSPKYGGCSCSRPRAQAGVQRVGL